MASMSYCRFENTAIDLNLCVQDLEDQVSEEEFLEGLSSDYERSSYRDMIELCNRFLDAVAVMRGDEVDK